MQLLCDNVGKCLKSKIAFWNDILHGEHSLDSNSGITMHVCGKYGRLLYYLVQYIQIIMH